MSNPAPREVLSAGDGRGRGRHSSAGEVGEVVDVMFRRHYAGLLRLAVVMLGDRGAAEDAVQDAFIALHRKSTTLRDPQAAEAYLRSAVFNRCRSWVRRQATSRRARPLLVQPGSAPAEPEDVALDRERAGSLVQQMRSLPPRQREVLACRYVLELSVAETARQLGISQGSVKVHAHRGLDELKKRIEVTA